MVVVVVVVVVAAASLAARSKNTTASGSLFVRQSDTSGGSLLRLSEATPRTYTPLLIPPGQPLRNRQDNNDDDEDKTKTAARLPHRPLQTIATAGVTEPSAQTPRISSHGKPPLHVSTAATSATTPATAGPRGAQAPTRGQTRWTSKTKPRPPPPPPLPFFFFVFSLGGGAPRVGREAQLGRDSRASRSLRRLRRISPGARVASHEPREEEESRFARQAYVPRA